LGDWDVAKPWSILRIAPAEKFQVIHFFKIESHQAATPLDESGFCKRERACRAEFHAADIVPAWKSGL
jgi:hypothetical protein